MSTIFLSFTAPFDLNVKSTGERKYKISWSLSLPAGQTVKKYHAYQTTVGSKAKSVDVSTDVTSLLVDVNYDTEYTFEIGVETKPGKSDSVTISWLSHSGIYM